MYRLVTLAALLLLASPAWAHWEVPLKWQAPAVSVPPKPAPTGYHVQRRLGLTGAWQTITTTVLPPTTFAYRDVGPYADTEVVCHRVVAQPQNPDGSNTGVEVCSNAPPQYPNQVGPPTVTWEWVLP